MAVEASSPSKAPQAAAAVGRKAQRYDLTTCATLLSCFDFAYRGVIDRDDWRRGTAHLLGRKHLTQRPQHVRMPRGVRRGAIMGMQGRTDRQLDS